MGGCKHVAVGARQVRGDGFFGHSGYIHGRCVYKIDIEQKHMRVGIYM
jgi:hypothetical protein